MRTMQRNIKLKKVGQELLEKQKTRRKMRKLNRQLKKARGQAAWYQRPSLLPMLRHLLPVTILLSFCSFTIESSAQVTEHVFNEERTIDSIPVGSLRAEVDAIAFFHDNEYSSDIQKGYSLPGLRLTPHLAYKPHQQVNIEVGATMLFYNGANKYPCYAYHDISTWKGNQYQPGCHTLPWVRLQGSFKHLDVVLGNIYGASNHHLSAPLFNAEQNLSADPEMGVQILTHHKHLQSDTWLNWQSYIFEEDSHQEAFTVGESMRILWGKTDKSWQWYTPLQITIQHRGGEQDTTALGVQTLSNALIGIGVEGRPKLHNINHIDAQVNALVSYQQAGHLWPFDTGFAMHAGAGISLFDHLHFSADYLFAPKQFISLFGNPFFSTISMKEPGVTYHGSHVLRIGADYHYTFARNYTLGAQVELFTEHAKAKGKQPCLNETNFSFGVYFRVSPSFLIKQF